MRPTERALVVLVAGTSLLACMPPQNPSADSCGPRPGCSFAPDSTTPANPLQQQLHCGPIYRYVGGSKAGFAGVGSFCPDTPETRRILHDNQKRGYLPGYCESCMGVPPGEIFVFWKLFDGPSCPSGCFPGPKEL